MGNPTQGESQSNDTVEEAGKQCESSSESSRTILEAKTRAKIHGTDPIMLWAIRWAAMVTSRYLVGKYGGTEQ